MKMKIRVLAKIVTGVFMRFGNQTSSKKSHSPMLIRGYIGGNIGILANRANSQR